MDIKKEIIEFIGSDENNGAFLLTGKWGCGKTHLVKGIVEELNECDDFAVAMISLFGIDSVPALNKRIKDEYLEKQSIFFGEKAQKFYKAFRKLAKESASVTAAALPENAAASAVSVGVNAVTSFDIFSFVAVKNTVKNKEKEKRFVLVFDDYERCGIPQHQLLGVINEYSENRRIKTIIIADEEKIKEQSHKKVFDELKDGQVQNTIIVAEKDSIDDSLNNYSELKEKLISRTIMIKPDYAKTIHEIIKDFHKNGGEYKSFVSENESILLSVFEQSQYNNFRSFISCLVDFERVYKVWKESDVSTKEMADVLYSFCAVTYEYKKGIYKASHVYNNTIYSLHCSEDDKKQIKEKYRPQTIECFFNSLSKWIVDGDWNAELFIEELKERFSLNEPTREFRFLNYGFWDLERADFEEALPKILEKAYTGKLSRDELIFLLQRVHAINYNNINLPFDIDYNKISEGLEIRKAKVKNGEVEEKDRRYEAFISDLDDDALELYSEIKRCDMLFYAWKNRREFIDAIKSNDRSLSYNFKNRFFDCFDDELLNIFIEEYKSVDNGQKREMALALCGITYKDELKNQNGDLEKTINNLKKLITYLNEYSNETDDYICQIVNSSFVDKINGKIKEIEKHIEQQES